MMAIPMYGHRSLLDFILLRRPPSSEGHVAKVQKDAARTATAAKKTSDVIREFIHDINADKQRDIVRREE